MKNIAIFAVSMWLCLLPGKTHSAEVDFDGKSGGSVRISDLNDTEHDEIPDLFHSKPHDFFSEGCSPEINPASRAVTCQIPDDALAGMSTGELLDAVLKYPYFLTGLLAAPDVQSGFESVTARFRGLRVLLKRKDVGTELLQKYRSAEPECPSNGASWGLEVDPVFGFYYLEILLAQDAIVSKLSEAQKEELKEEISKKSGLKKEMKECYGGGFNREIMILLHDRLRIGKPAKPVSAVVYTPKNSPVEAFLFSQEEEFTQWQMQRCDGGHDAAYPEARRETSCSRLYNCHSYAWHDQSLPNYIWINDPSIYWKDGSYIELSSDIPPAAGINIFYNSPELSGQHSAILVSNKNTSAIAGHCRSKWGQGPRMLHNCGYVPSAYDLTDMRVYVKTPIPKSK